MISKIEGVSYNILNIYMWLRIITPSNIPCKWIFVSFFEFETGYSVNFSFLMKLFLLLLENEVDDPFLCHRCMWTFSSKKLPNYFGILLLQKKALKSEFLKYLLFSFFLAN